MADQLKPSDPAWVSGTGGYCGRELPFPWCTNDTVYTWSETHQRCLKLASALSPTSASPEAMWYCLGFLRLNSTKFNK
ncbi:hypothetical protein H6P81_017803 [Aristolochia fimbriata]|uniref:Uncharacterized protein n=1 Tax=Aristolochia fimbriata TaxID=158543 RepID=A0AAV7DZN6_ARIFI|nr:hypothetical protein H6P81_017803 [Aristolochia fimbriata]